MTINNFAGVLTGADDTAHIVIPVSLHFGGRAVIGRIVILAEGIVKIHQHLLNLLAAPTVFTLIVIHFKLSPGKDRFQGIGFVDFLH